MSVSKVALKNKFYAFCQLVGVPCGIEQAEKMKAEYFATLDFDRTNGGYLPVMIRIETKSQYGFMRFSTSDKRLSLSKMFDRVCEWCEVATFIKENGFPALSKGFESGTAMLEKSDTITVHTRRYEEKGSTYCCVRVFVNGSVVGHKNDDWGSESYPQTAKEILVENGYYVGETLNRSRAKVLYLLADVKKSKHAKFN